MKIKRKIAINYYIRNDDVSIEDSEYKWPIFEQLERDCQRQIYKQTKEGYTSGELIEVAIIDNEEVEFHGWWGMDTECL